MGRRASTAVICTGLSASMCACASMNAAGGAMASGGGAVASGGAAVYHTGSTVVGTTVGETYNGLGGAVRRPFQDFNMMQDTVAPSLEQAIKNPYDTAGLTSCDKINAKVGELDMALGPDLDTPKVDEQRDRWQRGASSAADYAVAAATGAADHFIPVRGVIRQLSGATKTEKHARQALLAGAVRRGFLKAVGMQQGCGWPAAPVDFKPDVATVHLQHAETTPAQVRTTPLASTPLALAPAIPTSTQTAVAAPASAIQAIATPPARPQDYAKLEATAATRSVLAPGPFVELPAAQPTGAASAPSVARPSAAAQPVHVAERVATPAPARRGSGVVERAPVGQSVVLPPRRGDGTAS